MIAKSKETLSAEVKELFENLTRLWAFTVLEEHRAFKQETRKLLQQEIIRLVDWVAPRSISILDVVAPPKEIIGSVFCDENAEMMKEYVTVLFSRSASFKKPEWHGSLISMRDSQK